MIEFHDIVLSDKEKACKALRYSDFMGCEYCFSSNLAWSRLAGTKCAFYKYFYIYGAFETEDNIPRFFFPAGKGDYKEVINELMDYTKKLNYPLILLGVTDDGLNKLSELFPEQFDYFFDRDDSDYIYETEEYISIKGNKNRGKRNHLNRFRKSGSVYSTITEKDFDDCIRFCESEFEKRESDANSSLIVEQHAIKKYFENFHELGLKGGMHRIDN